MDEMVVKEIRPFSLLRIDADGFLVEPVRELFEVDEEGNPIHGEDLVQPYDKELSFFVPKYNRETREWTEGLPEEEVILRQEEIAETQARETDAEKVARLEDDIKLLQLVLNDLMLGG